MAAITKRKDRHGKIRYRAMVRRKGSPAQSATFPTLKQAQQWASLTEGKILEGKYFPEKAGQRHTLGEAIGRYELEVLPWKAPGTIYHQARILAYWRREQGCRLLANIDTQATWEWRSTLLLRLKPATVRAYLAVLGHVLTMCVEWQWCNPVKIKRPELGELRTRALSEDEYSRLLSTCKASKSHYLYPVVLLALSTGARKGEIFSLLWNDVDLRRKIILFRHTKAKRDRIVPLLPIAVAALRSLERKSRYVFFNHRTGRHISEIHNAWEVALRRASISDFRFHDLRHTTASWLALQGANLQDIAQILGHSTVKTTMRYVHLTEGHARATIGRLANILSP